MTGWVKSVNTTAHLNIIQKALKLAITAQKVPVDLRRELRQDCAELLQITLPKETGAVWVATMCNASRLFLGLQKNILEVKIASRG